MILLFYRRTLDISESIESIFQNEVLIKTNTQSIYEINIGYHLKNKSR